MANDDLYSDSSNYGYTPSLAWSVVFIVIFSISGLVHSYQAYRAKLWIVYPTLVVGALTEILGWSGRLWSHQNVLYLTPFLMQISTLIIAPVFFSAYDYVILGLAIRRLGPQYAVIRPGYYFIIFITADLISLILQAVGGGQASSSAADGAPTQSATNIMVAGIIFQLVSMGIFVALGFDFIRRATSQRPYAFRERQIAAQKVKKAEKERKNSEKTLVHAQSDVSSDSNATLPTTATTANGQPKPVSDEEQLEQLEARENLTRWWIMLGGCLLSSLAIVVRGIYRSIELVQGWDGEIIHTEVLQAVLDGIMMVIACGVFNFINPLYLLPKRTTWKGFH